MQAGQLPGVHAPEAPAHDAHLGAVVLHQVVEEVRQAVQRSLGRPDVAAQTPALGDVAEAAQVEAQRRRRTVIGEEPGQHEHRVTIARRQATQDGMR